MTSHEPPRLATWLLLRFVGGPNRESLIGDLEEQFRCRRSRWWYRRQVVNALLAEALTDIRQHKLLTSGIAMLVWIIVILWVEGTWWLYLAAGQRWPILNRSTFWLWYGGGTQVVWCAGAAMGGWVAARLGGRSSAAMILVSLVMILPLCVWWGGPWLIRSFETGAWWRIPQRVFALTVLVGMPMGTLIGGLVAGPANRTSS